MRGFSRDREGAVIKSAAAHYENAGLILVLLAGIWARCQSLGFSLCGSETWVVNSVLAPNLSEMFYYPDWLQTTPPLFLVLLRVIARIFGDSPVLLRAVPLFFSIISIVLLAIFCKRVFPAPFALLCTALVTLSPTAIGYAKEVKQYSADLAVTVSLFFALWSYMERPSRRYYVLMLIAFVIGCFLSYTAVMFVPLALFAIGASPACAATPRPRRKATRCAGLLLLTFAATMLTYIFFVRPNMAPAIVEFWRPGYPPAGGISALVQFYCKHFLGLAIYFFVGSESKESLTGILRSLPAAFLAAGLVVAAALAVCAAVHFRRNQRYIRLAAFAILPVLALAACNLARLYPVGARRLMLFLLPCVALALTLIVQAICETVGRTAPDRMRAGLLHMTGVSIVGIAIVLALSVKWNHLEEEDVESAFRYVRTQLTQADAVYIHAALTEPWKYYLKHIQWPEVPIVHGRSNGPCCARTPGPAGSDPEIAAAEADAVRMAPHRGATWLLFSNRKDLWEYLRRNDAEGMVNRFHGFGCDVVRQGNFANVLVYRVGCHQGPRGLD